MLGMDVLAPLALPIKVTGGGVKSWNLQEGGQGVSVLGKDALAPLALTIKVIGGRDGMGLGWA